VERTLSNLVQYRTHNDANEVTQIDDSTTHVGHDAVGNMTKVPQPASWSASCSLTWEAWDWLVKVADGANTVGEYDGLHRRISKAVYTGGALDHTEHFYVSEDDQVLEVRFDSDTAPTESS
jgi:hypothetical protein